MIPLKRRQFSFRAFVRYVGGILIIRAIRETTCERMVKFVQVCFSAVATVPGLGARTQHILSFRLVFVLRVANSTERESTLWVAAVWNELKMSAREVKTFGSAQF